MAKIKVKISSSMSKSQVKREMDKFSKKVEQQIMSELKRKMR